MLEKHSGWRPASVCDLYCRRWDIEVCSKQVKQALKFGTFHGHSATFES